MRGYTVEMSFLTPIILLLVMSSMYAVFYFHDKNIIAGAAYETAVVGSNLARKQAGTSEGELSALFRERVSDKCILLTGIQEQVEVTDQEVRVYVEASYRKMAVSVEKKMSVTDPEKKLREKRKLKGLLNGA